MKKNLILTLLLFASSLTSVMVLSSFVAPNQECSLTEMNDNNNWKLFRENVPYCDGANDVCEGYGYVWVNTETYQIAFSVQKSGTKFDLSEYTDIKGYNMRFWMNYKYHYVNIFIPKSAFE